MFIHHSLEEVERLVNEWLGSAPGHVHHVVQSQSEKGGKFYFVLSVIYESTV